MISHLSDGLPSIVLAESGDRDMADWRLEFDQRMSLVVVVGRGSFTVSTEIGVGADGTLVSVTTDIVLATLDSAQWTIAVDAKVCLWARTICGQWLVQRDEAVTRMDLFSAEVASRAVVPVGAVQALVAHSGDCLY